MKKLIFVALFISALPAMSAPVDGKLDAIVCAKKNLSSVHPNDIQIFAILQSQKLVKYETLAGGDETDKIVEMTNSGNTLLVKDDSGTIDILTVDLKNGSATWQEDKTTHLQAYPFCTSFAAYDSNQILKWLKQIGLYH